MPTRRLPRGKQQRGDNHRLKLTPSTRGRRGARRRRRVAVRFISRRSDSSEAIDIYAGHGRGHLHRARRQLDRHLLLQPGHHRVQPVEGPPRLQ